MSEARHRSDIQRYLGQGLLYGRLRNRRKPGKSGIVYEDAHRRIRCEDLFDTDKVRFLREVSGDHLNFGASIGLQNLFREGLYAVGASRHEDEIVAPSGEAVGINSADA